MYEITVPPGLQHVVCADISEISKVPEEKQFLFDMDTAFELVNILPEQNETRWIIRLLANDRGNEFVTEYIQENIRHWMDCRPNYILHHYWSTWET